MKPQFVRCEMCKAEIQTDACKLAAYKTVIDGQEYAFCCQQCAKRYKEKKTK